MNFESLLVVTYGRSGSTLLTGVLNTIPGVLIRGENYNFCNGLHQAYQTLCRVVHSHSGADTSRTTSPWFGGNDLSIDAFLRDATLLIRNQLVPAEMSEEVRCYGFKEIRYLPGASRPRDEVVESLANYVAFLELVFPKVGIVSLTRDHDAVCASGWWSDQDPELVAGRLSNFEYALQKTVAERKNHFGLTYDDLVKRSDHFVALFDFLGVPYDSGAVESTLGTRHSYF